jgi:DNA-binding PadR family transcriptional regulator
MDDIRTVVDNLMQELRRGTLVLGVLSQLRDKRYGYSLVEHLKEKQVEIEPGTLYPLLRRLEKQGLLSSEWETSTGKPRKYYILSAKGLTVLDELRVQWKITEQAMDSLIEDGR